MIVETIAILVLLLILSKRFIRCPLDAKPLVQVIVLGDIGHSPRMQYHAVSLAETGKVRVELIGFGGSSPLGAVLNHPDIRIRRITALYIPPSWKVPFVVYGVLKVLVESVQLLWVLLFTSYRPECVLLQCPPAVPALGLSGLICRLTGSSLVVDFHNITHMHLRAKVSNGFLISMVRLYEKWCSRLLVTCSLCVTKAMKRYLEAEFGLSAGSVTTLYDRAGPQFKGRTSMVAKRDLENRLISKGVMKRGFSEFDFVIVSSTSWTKDEDFSLLLEALPEYSIRTGPEKRTLLFITGKGEMREEFEKNFNLKNFTNITLVTAWLPASDYPLVLGLADVGVSVHTSTSGLDLPMKVVDMLGSEVAVVALNFPALPELLGHKEEGGLVFSTAKELSEALVSLTCSENGREKREKLARFGSKFRQTNWKAEWTVNAWPVFEKLIPKRSRQSRRRTAD